VPALETCLVVA